MKTLSMIMMGLLLSFATNAGQSGSSGQFGMNVDCEFKDGTVKYIPKMICKYEGGKSQ